MKPILLLLMAFHLIGVLFNIRLLASCFKDKTKYTILQKCRPAMIFQCILQLILLALNAYQVTKAFSDHQEKEWCGTNGVFTTPVAFFLIYNLLAILAIEDPSIVGLKRKLSPIQAMSAAFITGIISCGILLWAGFFSTAELCTSHLASIAACWLMIGILLVLAWKICMHVDQDAAKTTSRETSPELNFQSKHKATVFLAALVVVCILFAILKLVETVVISLQQRVDFQNWTDIQFFQKLVSVNVIWLAVGIALPVCFQQLIDYSADAYELMKTIPA